MWKTCVPITTFLEEACVHLEIGLFGCPVASALSWMQEKLVHLLFLVARVGTVLCPAFHTWVEVGHPFYTMILSLQQIPPSLLDQINSLLQCLASHSPANQIKLNLSELYT